MRELMAQHRPERRLGNARHMAPHGDPVRPPREGSGALGAHGAKDEHGVVVHCTGRVQVRERRRARGTRCVDDPDGERRRIERGVPAGIRERRAEVGRLDGHSARV